MTVGDWDKLVDWFTEIIEKDGSPYQRRLYVLTAFRRRGAVEVLDKFLELFWNTKEGGEG